MENASSDAARERVLAGIRRAAERESAAARARAWRDAPMEEHARVLAELLDLADMIIAARGGPPPKPPLPANPLHTGRANPG
ncbi:MAG: hypothetical protein IT304_00375 [Dehalococcoidia bacterium]|nr:hypothetical protein [Dehalococcoidia bacterium]